MNDITHTSDSEPLMLKEEGEFYDRISFHTMTRAERWTALGVDTPSEPGPRKLPVCNRGV